MNNSTDLQHNQKETQYVPFYNMSTQKMQSKKFWSVRLIPEPIKIKNISTQNISTQNIST